MSGEMCRKWLGGAKTSVRVTMVRLLARGARLAAPRTAATCRDLMKQFACLWTLVTVEGVGPTNNESERACARRLSHGV